MPRSGKRTRQYVSWVVDWFDSQGYDVTFTRSADSMIRTGGGEREVIINSSPSLECQLHILLHEAGHLLVTSRTGYAKKFEYGYPSSTRSKNNPKCKTVRHWVHIIHEEYEAWEEGLALAGSLGIKIRTKAWERIRTEYLASYFRAAARERPKGGKKRIRKVPMNVSLFWLDDEREAPDGWIRVRTGAEAIAILAEQRDSKTSGLAVWSLDHDLGEETALTGYDVLKWVEETTHLDSTYDPPRLLLHTANPIGRQKMVQAIASITAAVKRR